MKHHQQRRGKAKLALTILAIAAIFFVGGYLLAPTPAEKHQPITVAPKQIKQLSVRTDTLSQTNKMTTFNAWCDYDYADGSHDSKYLGKFTIQANLPEQFGFVTDKCDNTLPR